MRTVVLALTTVFSIGSVGPGLAQTYPSKVIRIIVPTVAGGTTDLLARMLADHIGARSGAQVVVENRPGASGTLGMDAVVKAQPDGYTLGFYNTALLVTPFMRKSAPFDPIKDLLPVGPIGEAPQLLVVNASLPVNSLQEFILLAKSQPGAFAYGSAGLGSTPHLAGDQFARLAGLDLVHVTYRGTAPAVVDVVRGEIQMISLSLGPIAGFVTSNKLHVLAAAANKRIRFLPDIPTASEAGLPGYEMTTWFGLFAPRGTPKEVVERLSSYISTMLDDAQVQKHLSDNSVEALKMSPEEFGSFLKDDSRKWERVVRDAGIQLQ